MTIGDAGGGIALDMLVPPPPPPRYQSCRQGLLLRRIEIGWCLWWLSWGGGRETKQRGHVVSSSAMMVPTAGKSAWAAHEGGSTSVWGAAGSWRGRDEGEGEGENEVDCMLPVHVHVEDAMVPACRQPALFQCIGAWFTGEGCGLPCFCTLRLQRQLSCTTS